MTAHYHDLAKSSEAVSSRNFVFADGHLRSATHQPESDESDIYRDGVKRLLDVVLVLVSLPLVLPIILVFAAIVALDGGKPFYCQNRVGKNGRTYTMWKLRSMVLCAEEKLAVHLAQDPEAKAEWDSTQKLKDDPRITRFGRFLRKSSFDELPQLLNVLLGDMSIVGPRPMLPEQEPLYSGTAYFELRPGITGLWQISDRNESTFAARAKFDTDYFEQLSLATDVRIIASTFRVVLRGTGY